MSWTSTACQARNRPRTQGRICRHPEPGPRSRGARSCAHSAPHRRGSHPSSPPRIPAAAFPPAPGAAARAGAERFRGGPPTAGARGAHPRPIDFSAGSGPQPRQNVGSARPGEGLRHRRGASEGDGGGDPGPRNPPLLETAPRQQRSARRPPAPRPPFPEGRPRKPPRDPVPPGLSPRVPRRQGPQNPVGELAGRLSRRCLTPPANDSQSRAPPSDHPPAPARPPARPGTALPAAGSPERAPETQTSPPGLARSRRCLLTGRDADCVRWGTPSWRPRDRTDGTNAAPEGRGRRQRLRGARTAEGRVGAGAMAHTSTPGSTCAYSSGKAERNAPSCPGKRVSGASSPDTTDNGLCRLWGGGC